MLPREQQLQSWVRNQLNRLHGGSVPAFNLDTLSGDASFRRYFRVHLPEISYVVVDAPPDREDNHAFVRIARALRAAGVLTPEVLAVDLDHGFMVQEDFGDDLYLQVLQSSHNQPDRVDRLYRQAIQTLINLQSKVAITGFPPYDARRLHDEMQLFQDWFCGRLLGMKLSATEQELVADCQRLLADTALEQPRVVVHRDYHSRNLMVLSPKTRVTNGGPGVIDFQDAVSGPYTYDLVSLLRDCYICWPLPYVQALALHYKHEAELAGIIEGISEKQFTRHFDLMGLQRHFKVMGIFARLCIRDSKPQFLTDIPQTMRYFLGVAEGYPEFVPLLEWFHERVKPLAEQRLAGVDRQ